MGRPQWTHGLEGRSPFLVIFPVPVRFAIVRLPARVVTPPQSV